MPEGHDFDPAIPPPPLPAPPTAVPPPLLPSPPLPAPESTHPIPPLPAPETAVGRRPPTRPLPKRATLAMAVLGMSGLALSCLAAQAFLPATALFVVATLTWWFPSAD